MPDSKFPYTVRVHSDDIRVVHAMRALAHNIVPRDSVKGTGAEAWREDSNHVTFRFRKPEQRDVFVRDLHEVLQPNTFSLFS